MKMQFLQLLSKIGLQKRNVEVKPASDWKPSFVPDLKGVDVNNDTALRFTAVFAAMRIRSENIASLPKSVLKETASGKEIAVNHPLHDILHKRPNGYQDVFTFWAFLNNCLDGWGNAYVIINRDSYGDVSSLFPVHPSRVVPGLYRGVKYYKISGNDGLQGVYNDSEICHFMLFSIDGVKGINPIVYNAEAIGNGMAATRFGTEFFEKGGNIKSVLETDGSLGDKEYNNFMRHYTESAKNFETPLLEYGIKLKQLGISPEAAQMLQTKAFSIQDIARIFSLPPHMLADLSRSTFSNIEHQDIQFVQYSLRPSVKRFEYQLENKLFFEGEADTYHIKFDLNGLLRGDMASRGAFYHNGIQDGWLNRNEVRNMEGLNREAGLEKFMYPANLNVVGETINKE